MSSFLQLNLGEPINKALIACGYENPTDVQAKSIPGIIEGKDVVVSAQTGTGKTAAFVLPALHLLNTQEASRKTRILILTPTRELANQITKAAMTYGKFLNFKIVSLVGGMSYHTQIKDLARGADIIVATPGRLMDHMEQKRVNLSGIEMLILDEADRMLDMGFIDDVEYIAKLTPANRQTLLFSATVDNKLTSVVRHLLKNPIRIDLSGKSNTSAQIKQELYKVSSPHQKIRLLKHFLADEAIYKAIIFSATKVNADKIASQLQDEGFSAAALHGDLKQNVRNRTLEQLRRGKIQFLVATDVAARGIDVSDITHVINYDMPRFCEDYVHRIGRTGRAGKTGIAISFVLPTDMQHVQRIERFIGQRLQFVQAAPLGHESSHAPAAKEHTTTYKSAARKDRFADDEDRDVQVTHRPKKKFGGKPERKFSDRSASDRDASDRRSTRKFSDRKPSERQSADEYAPSERRKPSERKFGDRKPSERQPSERSFAADRKPSDRRKTSERKFSDRKPADRQPSERHFDDERKPSDRRKPLVRKFSDRKPSERQFDDERSPSEHRKPSTRKFSDRKPSSDRQPSERASSERKPSERKFADRKPSTEGKPTTRFARTKKAGDEHPKRSAAPSSRRSKSASSDPSHKPFKKRKTTK